MADRLPERHSSQHLGKRKELMEKLNIFFADAEEELEEHNLNYSCLRSRLGRARGTAWQMDKESSEEDLDAAAWDIVMRELEKEGIGRRAKKDMQERTVTKFVSNSFDAGMALACAVGEWLRPSPKKSVEELTDDQEQLKAWLATHTNINEDRAACIVRTTLSEEEVYSIDDLKASWAFLAQKLPASLASRLDMQIKEEHHEADEDKADKAATTDAAASATAADVIKVWDLDRFSSSSPSFIMKYHGVIGQVIEHDESQRIPLRFQVFPHQDDGARRRNGGNRGVAFT